jgi:hypothetical protein
LKKKTSKSPAKDSGKVKETIREAKENLKKIDPEIKSAVESEFPPPIPQPPKTVAPTLIHHPKQPPVSERTFTDIYEDLQENGLVDWNAFIDKIAALGLCSGFISLGIVIGLNLKH